MDFSQPGMSFYGNSYRLGQTLGGPSFPATDLEKLKMDKSASAAAFTAILFFGVTIASAFVSYMAGVIFHKMIHREYNFRCGLAAILPPITTLLHVIAVCMILDADVHREGEDSGFRSLQSLFFANLEIYGVLLVAVWLVTSVRDTCQWLFKFRGHRIAEDDLHLMKDDDEESRIESVFYLDQEIDTVCRVAGGSPIERLVLC